MARSGAAPFLRSRYVALAGVTKKSEFELRFWRVMAKVHPLWIYNVAQRSAGVTRWGARALCLVPLLAFGLQYRAHQLTPVLRRQPIILDGNWRLVFHLVLPRFPDGH
jgi:hypothetical protein